MDTTVWAAKMRQLVIVSQPEEIKCSSPFLFSFAQECVGANLVDAAKPCLTRIDHFYIECDASKSLIANT